MTQTRAVDRSIVSELMAGELANWPVGLCEIAGEREVLIGHYEPIAGALEEAPDRLTVYGEGGHSIAVVELPEDVDTAMTRINEAIRQEYDAL